MADAWYSTGTLWAAAGAIAVIVVGIAGIVVGYRQANPIQRLGYETSQASLFPDSAPALSSDLRIMWKGTEVQRPHIVDIGIITHGRQDIGRQNFDDQPLEFRLEGAEFLAVLKTANRPPSAAIPSAAVEKGVLKIGPGHIYRRQSVKFTLLADGADPTLRTPSATLDNVDLVNLSVDPSRRPRYITRWAAGASARASTVQAHGIPAAVAAELQSPSQPSELRAECAQKQRHSQ